MPTLALICWPAVALVLFVKLGTIRGFVFSTAIGYLFLPDKFGIDLPLLPTYDKDGAVAVGLIAAYFMLRKDFQALTPASTNRVFHGILLFLLVIFCVTPVMTSLTNTESVRYGPTVLPGLRLWDAVSTLANKLPLCVPYFFGAMLLTRREHFEELLRAVVFCGLGYSLLVGYEIRMSPQLNVDVYGYFPHSWRQHVRGGSYRPIVFLRHGLWLALFMLTVIIAAFALSRDKGPSKILMLLAGAWMSGILLISNNLGAALLAFVFVPLVLLTSCRTQVKVAACIAVLFISYPGLKHYSATPTSYVMNVAERISPDRARSLQSRLTHEAALLEHALKKPLFGWGGWRRNRVLDEQGRDTSTIDGRWIDVFGKSGWFGYISFYGLLVMPMLFLLRSRTSFSGSHAVAGMALMGAANLLYIIPNFALTPIGMMIFGGLAGFVRMGATITSGQSPGAQTDTPQQRHPQYTRFPKGPSGQTVPTGRIATRPARPVRSTRPDRHERLARRPTKPKTAP